MAYEFLAGCYDRFTADVDYPRWADYIEKHFARSALPIRTVLDLACGTGSLTAELAARGYEMIGADCSEEMLSVAAEKCRSAGPVEPIFLHQAMEDLDLYGTIDACVCCLDSVNYVTRPRTLARAFRGVHTFLMPGGLFLFDVNTPDKLRAWTARSSWMRMRMPTASGGRTTPPGGGSAPTAWTSFSGRRTACGGGRRRSTRNTPMSRRSWRTCSGAPASGTSDNMAN